LSSIFRVLNHKKTVVALHWSTPFSLSDVWTVPVLLFFICKGKINPVINMFQGWVIVKSRVKTFPAYGAVIEKVKVIYIVEQKYNIKPLFALSMK
jgi:hypothetical protein